MLFILIVDLRQREHLQTICLCKHDKIVRAQEDKVYATRPLRYLVPVDIALRIHLHRLNKAQNSHAARSACLRYYRQGKTAAL